MKFSLIVCTYMRPAALLALLRSVRLQTLYPDEILIVDGGSDDLTRDMIEDQNFLGLRYFLVPPKDRGLTRQRNFGIARLSQDCEIICFLDDDIILEPEYFEQIMRAYEQFPDAAGVGGYILNEAQWEKSEQFSHDEFYFDGYKRREPSRFMLRKKFGLDADVPPGHAPSFSHGRSIGFLPPSGKVYAVQQLMGGVSSFRKNVFNHHRFSDYFEGYGLYEDADFTLRVSKNHQLYINTAAGLHHHHDSAGRPDKFRYGKMVVRNGYYVWRVGNQNPSTEAKLKWNAITLLLAGIRFSNAISGPRRREALAEAAGRIAGWFSLLYNKPSP